MNYIEDRSEATEIERETERANASGEALCVNIFGNSRRFCVNDGII